ncbi:MAG: EAL domain-containing protein [Burkholderiaceae bacterium]|nr:EAL domain-containing protein [Burkholderiaceae bacterium]
MAHFHRRVFTFLVLLVLAVAGASVVVIWDSINHIKEELPLSSLHKERDIAALMTDIGRLEDALWRVRLAPNAENLEYARFALDLVVLRVRDNRLLYEESDLRLRRFHHAIGPVLSRVETLVAVDGAADTPVAEARFRAQIAAQQEMWSELRKRAQVIRDTVFQTSIELATVQRKHLATLRSWLFVGVGLFTLGVLSLIVSLARQRKTLQQLQDRDAEIGDLAFRDALTGLANRRMFVDRINQALVLSARKQQYGAIIFLDLDRFKLLNDTHGHDVGDQLLVQVARRLTKHIREVDTVARFGGDEFVVMLEGLGTDAAAAAVLAETVAEKVRDKLNVPYYLDNVNTAYHNSPSQGVTLFLGQRESVDVLLKQADLALYQAKDAGRNAICFFSQTMQAAVESRTDMQQALRNALCTNELLLHYHPQVKANGEIVGGEALLRWQPVGQSLVMPGEFIAVAEDSGLIVPMGEWALRTVCEQLKRWQNLDYARGVTLSVNVSAKQFYQSDFHTKVVEVLAATGAPPQRLKLELVGSVLLDNVADAAYKMRALRELGVGFCLDDFGTGYSSLPDLKRLPVEQLKIDRSFVAGIGRDESDEKVCAAIVHLAHNLDIKVVAQGVETEAQRHFLADLHHCDLMQGYLFCRAKPIEKFEALLRDSHAALIASRA